VTLEDHQPPPWIAENAGFLLAKAGEVATKEFRARLEELGIKPRHYSVLSVLHYRSEPSTQHIVAGCLELEPSSVVGVVDELEALGLVERQRDHVDRRRNVLVVTDRGNEVLAKARRLAEESERTVLAGLSEDARNELRALLITMLGSGQPVPTAG
jgi:DNA-binding MarR family transcriptional regulator